VKVDRQKPVINVKNKIELATFHQIRNTGLPGKEFKLYLVNRPHTAGASVGAQLCRHCQGRKCESGFSSRVGSNRLGVTRFSILGSKSSTS